MNKICKSGLHQFEGRHCKACAKISASKYYYAHKEVINNSNKEWMSKNKNERATYKREYRKKNKQKIKEYKNKYDKHKVETDIRYKLMKRLRSRLSDAIKNKIKAGSAVRDLGCTCEELGLYLESLFQPGMSWDNYGNKEGNWSIDHIIPLSRVDLEDREQFIRANHYTNLQPLWHIDNMRKGNKMEDIELNK
jgi:hypothetical protein